MSVLKRQPFLALNNCQRYYGTIKIPKRKLKDSRDISRILRSWDPFPDKASILISLLAL